MSCHVMLCLCLCYLSMQTVKCSEKVNRELIMRDHPYKMEQNDNSGMTDGEYDNVELVSKSGDSILISLVQNYPHLYVKTSKNQKDNTLREKSWQEIAAILEQPASECLKRWTRLRERYSKEKRLSEQSMKNGHTNRQSWPHYAEMGFLAQHIVGRRSYRNINARIKRPRYEQTYSNEAPSPPEEAPLSPSPGPFTSTLVVQSPSPSPSTSTALVPTPELLSPAASEQGPIFVSCNRRGKRSVKSEESILDTPATAIDQLRNSSQQLETSEDFFCKYLASELKKMSEVDKKATTRRLLDALFQENT